MRLPSRGYNPLMTRRDFLVAGGALAPVPHGFAHPATKPIRSVQRLFCSDVEDKPWFNDREMWPRYLAMLAENRFTAAQLSSATATGTNTALIAESLGRPQRMALPVRHTGPPASNPTNLSR